MGSWNVTIRFRGMEKKTQYPLSGSGVCALSGSGVRDGSFV